MRTLSISLCLLLASVAAATPTGFVKTTITLSAPPVGLAFDANGVLYALEGPAFMSNQATVRIIQPSGTISGSFTVAGDDPTSFYVGDMTYDAVGDQLLITDNTTDGRLYAVSKAGVKQTLSHGIAGIAGVAVRESGEILVSSSPAGPGEVLQVNRDTGVATSVLGSLGYGAGLSFVPAGQFAGDLVVQDINKTTFAGRLQRLPITESGGGLSFGMPDPVLSGMQSGAGVKAIGSDGICTTGAGGLYRVAGSPAAEILFDSDGSASPYATAMAFDAGSAPFQRYAGPDGGRLAYMADFGFAKNDSFVTLLTPATQGDYNTDGTVNGLDYAVWRGAFGALGDQAADGNGDGIVNGADYVLWRNYAAVGAGASISTTVQVPEPASAMLVTMCVLVVVANCGRRSANSRIVL